MIALQIFGACCLAYMLIGCAFLAMQPLWQLRTAISVAEQSHHSAGQHVPRGWIAVDMISDFVLRWPLLVFEPPMRDHDDDLDGMA